MANIKFSAFTEVTDVAAVTEIVGYNGTQNVRITPANFVATTGPFLPLAGGTMTGNIVFNSGVRAQFGGGNSEIFFTGSNFVASTFAGDFIISNYANDKDIILQSDDGSGGVTPYFFLDGGGVITRFEKGLRMQDNIKFQAGSSGDFNIRHNGTDSFIENDTGDLYIKQNKSDADIIFQSDDGSGGEATYLTLDGSTTDAYFTNPGNVGIGTTSPGAKLEVLKGGTTAAQGDTDLIVQDSAAAGSTSQVQILGGATGFSNLYFSDTSAYNVGGFIYNHSSNYLATNVNASEKMRITSAGDVGIGTTSPDHNLQVENSGNAEIQAQRTSGAGVLIQAQSAVGVVGTNTNHRLDLKTNGGTRMSISNTGKVGIGTTSPASELDVVGRVTLNDGQNNVLVGTSAGESITTGVLNTLIGKSAGANITTSTENVIIGSFAGDALTVGDRNVAIGHNSLSGEVQGDRNVAIGYDSLRNQSNGSNVDTYNAAVGYVAGLNVTTGVRNTLIGALSGDAITTGSFNVALGMQALSGLTTGNKNVALGTGALELFNQAGDTHNVAVGYTAGQLMTTGVQNTLIGALSGDAIRTGQDNVAVGYASLTDNVAGNRNVAIGRAALADAIATGSAYNTAMGYNAGNLITTGVENTILGGLAGDSITTGTNNIIIGYESAASAVDVDNEIVLGNSSIATLRCETQTITGLSDERDKTSIQDLPYGLDFVNSLQPKKFVWDHRAETRVETDEEGNETQKEFYSSNKGKKDIGFIAQELQSVDNEFTKLVHNSNPEKLEATYGRLIPVLVKAIQDLSAKVTALENA